MTQTAESNTTRTNIVFGTELVETAMRMTGLRIRRELVDHALRELVRREQQMKLLELRGAGGLGRRPQRYAHQPTGRESGMILVDTSVWIDGCRNSLFSAIFSTSAFGCRSSSAFFSFFTLRHR